MAHASLDASALPSGIFTTSFWYRGWLDGALAGMGK